MFAKGDLCLWLCALWLGPGQIPRWGWEEMWGWGTGVSLRFQCFGSPWQQDVVAFGSFEQWEASQAYWCQAVLLHCLSRTQWGLDHEAGYINIDNYHPSVVFIGPGSVLVLFSPWVKRSTWHWVWWQGLTIVLGPRSIPSSSHHSRRTKALP